MKIPFLDSIAGFFAAMFSICGGGNGNLDNDYQQPPLSEREQQQIEIIAEPSPGMLSHVIDPPPDMMVVNYIIYRNDETVVYTADNFDCDVEQKIRIEGFVRRIETDSEERQYYKNFHIDASVAECIDS